MGHDCGTFTMVVASLCIVLLSTKTRQMALKEAPSFRRFTDRRLVRGQTPPSYSMEKHLLRRFPRFSARSRDLKRPTPHAYTPNEAGGIQYPAGPVHPDIQRMWDSWRKPDGFLPGTAGKQYELGGKPWDPATGGGHPDFDVSIGPWGEKLEHYGKWNPLDPKNWLLGLDEDAADHMLGIPRPAEKGFWESIKDTLMFWKPKDTHDYSVHHLRPGGEGSDDFRMYPMEDENGNGPGDTHYLGYNITHANGTKEFVPVDKVQDISFRVELENGTWAHIKVPLGEERPPMYDNWWTRFHEKFIHRGKIMRTPSGGEPTELGTYGPISHLLGKNPKDNDWHDPRWSRFD
eukprot:jgi/Bigna1/67147/fgenesh1_pg.3_\